MWIATLKSVSIFDGYALKKLTGQGFDQLRKVTSMETLPGTQTVVLGTEEMGVFITDGVTIRSVEWRLPEPTDSLNELLVVGEDVWLIYPQEIYVLQQSVVHKSFANPLQHKTYSALVDDSGDVWLAGTDRVFQVNASDQTAQEIPVNAEAKNRRKLTLESGDKGQLWLGRSDGLYRYQAECQCFAADFAVFSGMEVVDLASINEQLWVATTINGLHMYDFSNDTRRYFHRGDLAAGQISDNSIMELYAGNHDMLWLGTFNHGINFIDTKKLGFHSLYTQQAELTCSGGSMVFDVYEHGDGAVWLATEQGLVRYDRQSMDCESFTTMDADLGHVQNGLIYSIFPASAELLWLTTSKGLLGFDVSGKKYQQLGDLSKPKSHYLIAPFRPNRYFLGSLDGLSVTDENLQILREIKASEAGGQTLLIDKHLETSPGEHYFAASTGLFHFNGDQLTRMPIKTNAGLEVKFITGLASDGEDGLFVASEEVVLVHLDGAQRMTDLSYLFASHVNRPLIYEMILYGEHLWLSSDMGLWQLDLEDNSLRHYGTEDGTIQGGFLKNSSHLGVTGTIYFGGKQGLVAFNPGAITHRESAPKVLLTGISQLDRKLHLGQQLLGGYTLNQDISQLKSMQLNHLDLAIGFEFAALDYASPEDNQYAFRLLGFNDTWNRVDARNRTATYTNLDPGDYTFEVKAANKDGVWSQSPTSLSITVKPAPWFSPWAYALYALTFVVAVLGFIHHRTASARKRSVELEVEVNQRTQELKTQKQMVESLLDHKNELFANVTHEFKTPLALIKGPADELLKEGELYPHKSKLDMIKRNANRLLVMVGQILKLSEVEQEQAVVRENQSVQPVLNMLFEAYRILAKDKNITLLINNQSVSQIHATTEYLEMVVGNLLSNAIKYTGVGGEVTLSSEDRDGQVIISVKDTGSGIAEQDQTMIFDRFMRLDSHRNIQGTGIGLAVVKEITQANGGQVSLVSELGQGSEFTLRLPQAQWQSLETTESAVVDQLVQKTAHEMVEDQLPTTAHKRSAAIKLLVIEDNADMRNHINDVLRDQYQCFYADRGQAGIATALKEMPDIIICDVMMPGMDGFQVTRILRHDAKTSHIPIILLTALNTKESRIKGWRENIDVYLTKPFDASELHATLAAILNVRKILQQKTQASFGVDGTTEDLDLPKQDLKFVKKLKSVIADNYHDIMFMRPQLASAMAVSERQLQRKVKALVADSPMNLLRDYRLEMAAAKLAEGFQVGVVGDDCGFSSVSYFAACFKKKYGMTPKKYQMTVNKKS